MTEVDGGRVMVVASVIYRPEELKKEVEELAKCLREALITALAKKKPHIHINPLHTSTSIRSSQEQAVITTKALFLALGSLTARFERKESEFFIWLASPTQEGVEDLQSEIRLKSRTSRHRPQQTQDSVLTNY